MPRGRGSWQGVDDGIVSGRLLHRLQDCDICHTPTCCVKVSAYELPHRVRWESVTILKRDANGHVPVFLGVGCGCYVKLHRQIVHIRHQHGLR